MVGSVEHRQAPVSELADEQRTVAGSPTRGLGAQVAQVRSR